MALEAITNYGDLLNLMVYGTPNVLWNSGTLENSCVMEPVSLPSELTTWGASNSMASLGVQGRKKRRRSLNFCRDKEHAEAQRMTHIAVERNRRKLMNDHLAVLRSLMPESYAQRGDQASIVGGAIEFVKELEHVVKSLEVKKLQAECHLRSGSDDNSATNLNSKESASKVAELFSNPQYPSSEVGGKYSLKSKAEAADIEVTLIETHANIRILSKKTLKQLSKMVSGFQTLHLTVLHLNVTSFDPFVLYSIGAKVEEMCQLNCVDSIAQAVLHIMLRIIEEDAARTTLSNLLVA